MFYQFNKHINTDEKLIENQDVYFCFILTNWFMVNIKIIDKIQLPVVIDEF